MPPFQLLPFSDLIPPNRGQKQQLRHFHISRGYELCPFLKPSKPSSGNPGTPSSAQTHKTMALRPHSKPAESRERGSRYFCSIEGNIKEGLTHRPLRERIVLIFSGELLERVTQGLSLRSGIQGFESQPSNVSGSTSGQTSPPAALHSKTSGKGRKHQAAIKHVIHKSTQLSPSATDSGSVQPDSGSVQPAFLSLLLWVGTSGQDRREEPQLLLTTTAF